MTLKDYLGQPDVNASNLAAACGVSVSTITRAAKGDLFPSRALQREIFLKTGGKVTPNSFVGVAA